MARKTKEPSPEIIRAIKRDRRRQRRQARIRKAADDFDWSTINVLPQSMDKEDYPYRASTKLKREDENCPLTPCGRAMMWKATIDSKRRWVFAFMKRSERDEFVRECGSLNDRKARKEPY